MKRKLDNLLKNWAFSTYRKVLLLRGARQVGKTYAIRQLGKTFTHFIEINFEELPAICVFFKTTHSPQELCQRLSVYMNIPIEAGKTLLFFDEIQACPEAISSLRFFYEKMPELHVVAAGSLLEFALAEIPSQGVGRLQSVFMYPMSFEEFLEVINPQLISLISQCSSTHPMDLLFHQKLIGLFKIYCIIGGLPEVVQRYVDTQDLLQCQTVLNDLLTTFQDDFAKYKKRSPILRLHEVFQSIGMQAGHKFKYANIYSAASSKQLKEALDLLIQAGLAYKVLHSSAHGLPLGAQINEKKFKVIAFDIGIHQRALNLNIGEFLLAENFNQINKGSIAEVFVGLELIKQQNPHMFPSLYYWHREEKSSNAEVDYVIEKNDLVIPIEVKAGRQGQMQSINRFMQEKHLSLGYRFYLQNFSANGNIISLPLYATSLLTESEV